MRCLIMGAPGAGKGTYAAGIKKYYSIPHISTGDIFRNAIQQETPMGLIAKSYIDKGQLVPDDITDQIVKERLQEADCQNGFLLDGFPRNLEQAQSLDRILSEMNVKLDLVVNIFVDNSLIISRIINRRICPTCGRSFNLLTLKPKVEGVCDDCGSSLYQRKDDDETTIKKRLEVYNVQTKPLIEYYEHQDIILHVDGAGDASVVTKRVIDAMEAR